MHRIPVIALLSTLLATVAVGCKTDTSGNSETTASSEATADRGTSRQAMTPNGDKPPKGSLAKAEGPRLDPGDVPPVGSTLELGEKEWRKRLSKKEFRILRKSGTEPRGSGDLLHNDKQGIYYCAGCGAPLFSSRHKYDSKTGWPSFYKPYEPGRVGKRPDKSMGMKRTEVYCKRCGGHLGHVFDDGPPPTGKRYCINSAALDFKPAEPMVKESSSGGESGSSSGDESGSAPEGGE